MHRDLEETIAHLTRTLDEVSDEVARQARRIEVLERRVQLLLEHAAEAEAAAQGAGPAANVRPPHW